MTRAIIHTWPIRVTVIDTAGTIQHAARWFVTPGRQTFVARQSYTIDRADWIDADGAVLLSLPGHEVVPSAHVAEGQWFTVMSEVVA